MTRRSSVHRTRYGTIATAARTAHIPVTASSTPQLPLLIAQVDRPPADTRT